MTIQRIGIPTTSLARTDWWDSVTYHTAFAASYLFPRLRPVPSYERVMELALKLLRTPITYSNISRKTRVYETLQMALQKAQEEVKADATERDQLEIKYDTDVISWRKDDAADSILFITTSTNFLSALVTLALGIAQFVQHKREFEGEITRTSDCNEPSVCRFQTLNPSEYLTFAIVLAGIIVVVGNLIAVCGNIQDRQYIRRKRIGDLRNVATLLTKNLYKTVIHRLMDSRFSPNSAEQQQEHHRRLIYWEGIFNLLTSQPTSLGAPKIEVKDLRPEVLNAATTWKDRVYIGTGSKDQGNEAYRTLKLSYFFAGVALIHHYREHYDLRKCIAFSNKLLDLIAHYAEVDPLLEATFPSEIVYVCGIDEELIEKAKGSLARAKEAGEQAIRDAEDRLHDLVTAKERERIDEELIEQAKGSLARAKEAGEQAIRDAQAQLSNLVAAKDKRERTETQFKENLASLMIRLRAADRELPTIVAKALHQFGKIANVAYFRYFLTSTEISQVLINLR